MLRTPARAAEYAEGHLFLSDCAREKGLQPSGRIQNNLHFCQDQRLQDYREGRGLGLTPHWSPLPGTTPF